MQNSTEFWDSSWRELSATPYNVVRAVRYLTASAFILFLVCGAFQIFTKSSVAGILSCIFMIVWVAAGLYLRREHESMIEYDES
jgi:hypothetical protein